MLATSVRPRVAATASRPRGVKTRCAASPKPRAAIARENRFGVTRPEGSIFKPRVGIVPASVPARVSATTADDRHIDKIFFVSWVPDTCKAKTKMLYASSKQALRNALDGVQLDHQATDYDEVTPEEFNERSGV